MSNDQPKSKQAARILSVDGKAVSRRNLVKLAGAASSAAFWTQAHSAAKDIAPSSKGPPPPPATGNLEAYTSATSVRQGGTIDIHGRNPGGKKATSFTMWIRRVGIGPYDQEKLVTTISLRDRAVPANASSAGCGWPSSYTLQIPPGWPSGLYYAEIGTDARACRVPFVVRPATRTPGTVALVQIPWTTGQAYNAYGGKSLYDYNSTGEARASFVSLDRPWVWQWASAPDEWMREWALWLDYSGIALDYCTSIDLHADASVLSGYQLLLTAGHDEYWTREMRQRVDAFVASGGNFANFSGNTCWWQARLAQNANQVANRTLVCYKSAAADPEPRPAYKTVNWIDLVPAEPENSTVGLSWKNGAMWAVDPSIRPVTPFKVQRDHWAFYGAGLTVGALFAGRFVGYETDTLEYSLGADGKPYPMATDGSATTARVLALADATDWERLALQHGYASQKSGTAMISVASRGGANGTIFNVGSTDWGRGLNDEVAGLGPTAIGTITRNVIAKLSSRHVETADVKRFSTQQTGIDSRYFFTIDGVGPSADAILEAVAFNAHAMPSAGTVPIYRLSRTPSTGSGRVYALSQQPAAAGWGSDGIAFHAYSAGFAGTVPVYQHVAVESNGVDLRHYYSTDATVIGWQLDRIAFHAPSA